MEKLIPLYLIEKSFGRSFRFHSNLLFKSNKTKFFPSVYLSILSQYLWYNANIQVDNTSIHFSRISEKNISYVSQLFDDNGSIKKWHKFKREYVPHQNSYFQWVQLIHSIPEKWKFIIKKKQ